MKKIVYFIVSIMLLVCCSGFSEVYDFSSLSDSELLDAKMQIDEEISSRGLPMKYPIPYGVYVSDVDLALDDYDISVSPYDGGKYVSATIYLLDQDGKTLIRQHFDEEGAMFVSLKEGMSIRLEGKFGSEFFISSHSPLPFAP